MTVPRQSRSWASILCKGPANKKHKYLRTQYVHTDTDTVVYSTYTNMYELINSASLDPKRKLLEGSSSILSRRSGLLFKLMTSPTLHFLALGAVACHFMPLDRIQEMQNLNPKTLLKHPKPKQFPTTASFPLVFGLYCCDSVQPSHKGLQIWTKFGDLRLPLRHLLSEISIDFHNVRCSRDAHRC